ncbi:hypothetical protein [Bdellovibrio sp. NC01]|uniref:hypothetical protein n=1 Tax=Bdellovibrio sp. NC01 TaxID=2220073 RepID=UPI001158A318|nr:hypothetical protein [Bdellovibrio sp. NC01]QDK37914.1 hypothetical protein DOE51_10125 [Bdellovibrio sp. NC01]
MINYIGLEFAQADSEVAMLIDSDKFEKQLSIRCWWIRICSAVSLTVALSGAKAFAFDPTTLSHGLSSLGGILGGIGGADEAIDVGFALTDLMQELDIEPSSEAEVQKAVTDLENLNSKVRDLRYSREEIRTAISEDLTRANSMAAKLRAIKNMIAASKRIAEITGLRPRAGMIANSVQQLKINGMILDELQRMRRSMYMQSIRENEIRYRRSYFLETIREEEGSSRRRSEFQGSIL